MKERMHFDDIGRVETTTAATMKRRHFALFSKLINIKCKWNVYCEILPSTFADKHMK